MQTLEDALKDYDIVHGRETFVLRSFLREVGLKQGEAQTVVSIAWKRIKVIFCICISSRGHTVGPGLQIFLHFNMAFPDICFEKYIVSELVY